MMNRPDSLVEPLWVKQSDGPGFESWFQYSLVRLNFLICNNKRNNIYLLRWLKLKKVIAIKYLAPSIITAITIIFRFYLFEYSCSVHCSNWLYPHHHREPFQRTTVAWFPPPSFLSHHLPPCLSKCNLTIGRQSAFLTCCGRHQ